MHYTLPRNVVRTTKTRFLASISLLTLLLLCYMTVQRMTSTWYFCGGRVLQCQFISSSWGFLSMVTPWFVSNIDNTSIGIETSLKWIFQGFWLQVQNSYFNQPFHGCFLQYIEKQYFEKLWSLQKNRSTRVFIPFLKYQVRKIT